MRQEDLNFIFCVYGLYYFNFCVKKAKTCLRKSVRAVRIGKYYQLTDKIQSNLPLKQVKVELVHFSYLEIFKGLPINRFLKIL